MRMLIASSAVLAIVVCGAVQAQTQTREFPSTTPTTQMERVTTPEFINQAWNINSFEIQAGQEAENKATDAAFKEYARMIVADHTKMQDRLKADAEKIRGHAWPTKLDNEQEQNLQQLKSASAANFEQQFKTQQIQGHERALRLFQSYAANGDNAELKSWAQASVTILQRHFDRAHDLPKAGGVM
jgi:putative membrane protein